MSFTFFALLVLQYTGSQFVFGFLSAHPVSAHPNLFPFICCRFMFWLRSMCNCSQSDSHCRKADLPLPFQFSMRSSESRGDFPSWEGSDQACNPPGAEDSPEMCWQWNRCCCKGKGITTPPHPDKHTRCNYFAFTIIWEKKGTRKERDEFSVQF